MKESDDIPKKLNYSTLPQDIEEIIDEKPEVIKKNATISFDGKQYMVRIPKEISNLIELTKDQIMKFKITMPLPRTENKPKIEITLENKK